MKIHEFQAKTLFSRYDVPITREIVCYTPEEALLASPKNVLFNTPNST